MTAAKTGAAIVLPKGLAASRHANGNGSANGYGNVNGTGTDHAIDTAGNDAPAVDGKSEPDHSSAALAIV